MSIGRALAEYISARSMPEIGNPGDEDYIPADPILFDGLNGIYPDVVNFVDQTMGDEFLPSSKDVKRAGMAYGIVSDILAPRYGGEAHVASVVFDFANRLSRNETATDQEFRFERAFSTILNILSVLPDDMRELYAYDGKFAYTVSSLQVTDSARALISAGFMRGYIIVDVGYTLGVNDGKG